MDLNFPLLFRRAIMHAATGRGETESRIVYQHYPSFGWMEMSVNRGVTLASGGLEPDSLIRIFFCVYNKKATQIGWGLGKQPLNPVTAAPQGGGVLYKRNVNLHVYISGCAQVATPNLKASVQSCSHHHTPTTPPWTGLPWGCNNVPAELGEHKDGGRQPCNSGSLSLWRDISLKMPWAVYSVTENGFSLLFSQHGSGTTGAILSWRSWMTSKSI